MKPLYPRPDYIPADFVFVGQGENFNPEIGSKYFIVLPEDEKFGGGLFEVIGHAAWRNDCDFYIPRPKKTIKEEKKVKYHIVDTKTGNPRWEIHGELGIVAKCPTRELARKVKRALSL